MVQGGRRISYGRFHAQVTAAAAGLEALGLREGDRIAVLLPSGPELAVALFAAARAGLVALPLSPVLEARALRRIFADARPAALVTDQGHAAAFRGLIAEAGGDLTLILTDHDAAGAPFRRPAEPEALTSPPQRAREGRALALYTSGSSGQPKRVDRTQRNLWYEAMSFVQSAGLTPEHHVLCLVPIWHSYGLGNGLLAAIGAGSTLVFLESQSDGSASAEPPFESRARRVLELVGAESIRVLAAVTPQYAALAELPPEVVADLSRVLCLSSGNVLPRPVYDRFFGRFGVPIRQIYGATEAGSVAANLATAREIDPASVGAPLENVSVKIVDEHDRELPDGEIGHVLVKSPVLPPVIYSDHPELSRERMSEGYFRMGDLGRRDARGQLTITGRKRTFIDTGGYKVDPWEIEQALATHPAVREVAVVGVDDPDLGEVIKAVVVADGARDPEALLAHCRELLARFQVPRLLELREALPRDSLGKLLHDQLRRPAADDAALERAIACLRINPAGILDRLAWHPEARRPPGPGEIEIEVHAAGLNFVDVLGALGMIPDDAPGGDGASPRLGSECSGRVVAVGPGVDDLRVGEDVVAVMSGCFRGHVTLPALLAVPRPAGLSHEQAASLPVAFATAYHALRDVARLAPGERVLIHAASGGVGSLAIQIARHLGAEVFATAGTDEKRAAARALGAAHVMSSRSLEFASEVLARTGGEGVDVVLNSLGGELLAASLGVLRDFGRFVELGKHDYYQDRKLGLRPFLRGLQMTLVDLRGLLHKRPAVVQGLLRALGPLLEQGVIAPPPCRVFPAASVVEAFRFMAEARHIGKIVISTRDLAAAVASRPQAGPERGWFCARLRGERPGARRAALARHVGEEAAATLRAPAATLSRDRPLQALGFDSLMAVEFRSRLEQSLALPLPASFVWNYPTIQDLATALLERLALGEPPAPQEEHEPRQGPQDRTSLDALLAQVTDLSDEAVDQLLAAR